MSFKVRLVGIFVKILISIMKSVSHLDRRNEDPILENTKYEMEVYFQFTIRDHVFGCSKMLFFEILALCTNVLRSSKPLIWPIWSSLTPPPKEDVPFCHES